MRCPSCSHILWNQPAPPAGTPRACSECGANYRVDDFDFVAGKVAFRCPHCATAYYGTSERGHLEPNEFHCAECSNRISMEDCVVSPEARDEGVDAMLQQPIPWIAAGPGFGTWFRTIGVGFTGGASLAKRLIGEPQRGRAAGFLFLIGLPSSLLSVAVILLFALGPLMGGAGPGRGTWTGIAMAATVALIGPAILVLTALASASVASSIAREQGPGSARLFEGLCYSSGPLIIASVPFCCTGFVGYIWWMVQCAIYVSAAVQGARSGAATVAVVLCQLLIGIVWNFSGTFAQFLIGF
jgi:hypothetical protein